MYESVPVSLRTMMQGVPSKPMTSVTVLLPLGLVNVCLPRFTAAGLFVRVRWTLLTGMIPASRNRSMSVGYRAMS